MFRFRTLRLSLRNMLLGMVFVCGVAAYAAYLFTPGMNIWHGSWGSPRLATIAGKDQILFPGGDGWLYSFEPAGDGNGNAKILWKFDGNPKSAIYKLGGIGTRNIPLTAPTVYRDKIYFATRNRLWAIEAPQDRNPMQKWLR